MDKIKPHIMYAEIEYFLHGFGEKEIENSDVYALARTLSDEAFPSYQDKFDTMHVKVKHPDKFEEFKRTSMSSKRPRLSRNPGQRSSLRAKSRPG